MNKANIIEATEKFVQEVLGQDSTGHDWYHIDRVRKAALYIAEKEGKGSPFLVEMAALLHDIPDEKINVSKEAGEGKLEVFLQALAIDTTEKQRIKEIVYCISFSAGIKELPTVEAEIVQDADRLDAIGAIGIARTFAYGGHKGQALYDPSLTVRENMTIEEYRKGKSSSIHHFYEKLLKLKDRLNTESAKKLADKRHAFMELFLNEFYNDWNGKYEDDLD
ncbi:HD domain-containing protein [Bacillus dakarensis]|uniref:HD domain-containing protein n=1 Tax=Robertmurraya dakarensis TaxID=1926278 RepID=UPI0009824C8D|nr:HD domain-containing protein [Bacillus dakarensis]